MSLSLFLLVDTVRSLHSLNHHIIHNNVETNHYENGGFSGLLCQVEYKYFSKYQRSWLSSLTFFLGILGTTTLIEEYRDMKKRQKNNVLQKHISDTKVTIETKRFYIFFSSFDFCLQRFFLVMKRHIYWHQSWWRNLMNQYQNVQK